jgi:hypothetical protein
MTIFNRLLIIVLAILLIVGAGTVLLISLGLIQPAQVAPSGWFIDRLAPFTQLDSTLRSWAIGISLLVIIVAVVLLVVELRPEPRPAAQIILKEDALGRVTVALDGVRELVDREAGRVVGVTQARSSIEEVPPGGLRIGCRVSVDPASSVPEMTQELQQRLKSVVEHHLGLSVTQVSIDAQVAPLVNRRSRRRVQ